LVNHFLQGIIDVNDTHAITVIDLLQAEVKSCLGCQRCVKNNPDKPLGTCSLKDDVAPILQSMLDSDMIVLASLIYCWSATALMMRFIERTYPSHLDNEEGHPEYRNQPQKGKRAVFLFSSGMPPPYNVKRGCTKHAEQFFLYYVAAYGCDETHT